ncbi:MAG: AraC family transcriptional regulator [Alteromonadaceae bacterium]|nr:MAG: AraC family transcriptional regulator [Alteromonadaceae bacterium]
MNDRVFNLHDVFLFVTAFECLLLALFQALQPQGKKLTRIYLGAFLIAMSLTSVATLFLWNNSFGLISISNHTLLIYCLTAASLARGPFLLLYVRSITNPSSSDLKKDAWHGTPVVLGLILITTTGLSSSDIRLEGYDTALGALAGYYWDFIKYVTLGYTAATLFQLYQYQGQLKQTYSLYSTNELNWLWILAGGFFINWSWGVTVHLVGKFTDTDAGITNSMGILANYITFLLMNILFIYSLVYAHKLLPTQAQSNKKTSEEKPNDDTITKVTHAIEIDRIYLEQNINIEQFSSRVGLPVKTVSNVINRHFGTNFFEFINSHRVEAAKAMLVDPGYSEQTILNILLQSGFNSKSAFHRHFKRFTGVSPSEFRQNALK